VTHVQDLTFDLNVEAAQAISEHSFSLEIPGYEVVGFCGSGATAKVYVAIQKSLYRQIALKITHASILDDEERISHFIQEGRINANLSHPNIVPIHDVGVVDDYHYISMEYMPWGNLRRHLKNKLELDWVYDVMKQISSALAFSHEHGFIHRDIKPENILFRDENSAVLSDFGIADELEHRTEITSKSSQGTPRYMSPDLIRSSPIGPSSDIYSLGIVFFEMLTGKPPFDSGTAPYTRKDVVSVLFAHVRDPIPQLPYEYRHIQPLIERMLAKRPKDRISNANDVIESITRLSQEINTV